MRQVRPVTGHTGVSLQEAVRVHHTDHSAWGSDSVPDVVRARGVSRRGVGQDLGPQNRRLCDRFW